jgi:hypothetical protein
VIDAGTERITEAAGAITLKDYSGFIRASAPADINRTLVGLR